MLRYKHLKPSLLIYLIATVLLFLGTVGITVIIILNDINGFNFISVQFLTCLASTIFKLNSFMKIILQTCFILSIGAILFALGQVAVVVWQFVMLRKDTEAKGENEENMFQELTMTKLIILYVFNAMGFLCIVPIVGSYLSFYLEFANCTGTQNLSSTYFLPTVVAGGAFLFQIWTLCMLLKLFYNFQHKDSENNGNDNKYDKLNSTARDKQKQYMEEMRQKIKQARRDLGNNKYAYNGQHYLSNSTQQQSPRQMENGLLNKHSRHYHPQGDSIYQNSMSPRNQNQSPSKNKSALKESRRKYGSKRGDQAPNKYRTQGLTATNQNNQLSPNNPANPNNPTNKNTQVNPNNPAKTKNSNDPTNPYNPSSNQNLSNPNNPTNSSSQKNQNQGNLTNSKNSPSKNNPMNKSNQAHSNAQNPNNQTNHSNSTNGTNPNISSQNLANAPKTIQQDSKKDLKTNKTATSVNGNEMAQMSPQQISQKQKELMKTLPKNPYKKNAHSKHLQPSSVIFEEPNSEEEGSEQPQQPQKIVKNTNQNNQNSKHSDSAKNKIQSNPLNISNFSQTNANPNLLNQPSEQQTPIKQRKQSQNFSSVQSPGLSPSMSPIMSPENNSFDFQDLEEIDLNNSPQSTKDPIRLKYLNSHYLRNLKNKNITPEERRKIKRPFLKLSPNVLEFDARNYQVTDLSMSQLGYLSKEMKDSKIKNQNLNKNQSETKNDPRNAIPPDQQHNQAFLNPNLLLSQNKPSDNNKSQTNSTRSKNSVSSTNLIQSILEAQKLQQENPILSYIDEDEDYEERLQKILAYDKISKKRRRFLYNPFDNGENKNNQKLYLHKNKMDKGALLTQNQENAGYDPFQDDDFDNVGYGTMKKSMTHDDEANPALRLDKRSNTKESDMSVVKKSKKQGVLLDFIRSKHVID